MTQPRSAPMPAALRANRQPPHPARTVRCPHCEAQPGNRCTTKSGRTRTIRLDPCPARLAAWAMATAPCPACQVLQTYPCHDNGVPRPDSSPVHAQRYTEAQETAA